jgi:hypothetical protein
MWVFVMRSSFENSESTLTWLVEKQIIMPNADFKVLDVDVAPYHLDLFTEDIRLLVV